jgi:hypothetical protein
VKLGFVFNVMVSEEGFGGKGISFGLAVMVNRQGFWGGGDLFWLAVMVSRGLFFREPEFFMVTSPPVSPSPSKERGRIILEEGRSPS